MSDPRPVITAGAEAALVLNIDLETRSVVNLKLAGAYVYAQHPSTDVLLASFSIGGGPIQRWRRGEPCPDAIRQHVEAGGRIQAFNAAFERLMWWFVLVPKHGWPMPKLEQFVCTAVTAAAMSLPRDLDRLGEALKLAVKKDKRGAALMKIHSIPIGFEPGGSPIWHPKADDPESLELYHQYCDDDVRTEMGAAARLVPLSDDELEIYWISERINDRGLRIDVKSAQAALLIAEKAKKHVNQEITILTAGAVTAVTQVARLSDWIKAQGVEVGSLDKDSIEELLTVEDLPERVEKALELRLEGAKPSVDKIAAMLKRVCADGRARGVYLHHGAGQTGRFSSRGVQAHNMPKYRKDFEKLFEDGGLDLGTLFGVIRTAEPAMFAANYGPEIGRPLHLLSDAVRSFIWAAPGHELVVADYSSIEGRMAAWFAHEQWKIEAFEALDAGTGPGMYELTAAGIYDVTVSDVSRPQRAVGKVAELSMGYQGGVGALRKMARQNKLKLHSVYESVWESADPDVRAKVAERHAERLKAGDEAAAVLGEKGWVAAELIKLGWRAKHPATVAAWADLNDAAFSAVSSPGSVHTALFGRVSYLVRHGFLWCRLPTGRCLAYGAPRIQDVEAPWADKTVEPKDRETTRSVTAMGVDSQSGRWVRQPLYGGKYFNNVVQGTAADVLRFGMRRCEARDWPVVLHTHDELGAEAPIGMIDVHEFEHEVCDLPEVFAGLPLTASGFASKRYHK